MAQNQRKAPSRKAADSRNATNKGSKSAGAKSAVNNQNYKSARNATSNRKTNLKGKQGWTASNQKKPRWPLFSAIGGVLLVVILVIVFVIVGSSSNKSGPRPTDATSAVANILNQIESVPNSVYNQVSTGSSQVQQPPKSISGPPLVDNGKPEMLYIGALWCPYCAAERWAMIAALSRFGTFDNSSISEAFSSSSDVYPSTPTFDFHHLKYSSPYISFVSVETQNLNHQTIAVPTKAEQALMNKYDSNGGIPFIDIGNKYYSAVNYNPSVLQGLNHQTIADSLQDPSSPTTQAIVGSANYLTAAICAIDNDQPQTVCNSQGVKAAASALAASHNSGSNS